MGQGACGPRKRGNEDPDKEERLNIEADALCDAIRNEATGPIAARGNCALRESEVCALFTKGTKITSKMKGNLQSQVDNKSLMKHLIERKNMDGQAIRGNLLDQLWYRLQAHGKSRHTAITKAYQNLWHTGTNYTQYYGKSRGCCLCGNEQEDWRHTILSRSLDADLNMADS
jgi:hypothetical protein